MDEYIDDIHPSRAKALLRWNEIDENHTKIKGIKKRIILKMYNNRDMVLSNESDVKTKNKQSNMLCSSKNIMNKNSETLKSFRSSIKKH